MVRVPPLSAPQKKSKLSKNPCATILVPFLVWGFFKLITPIIDPVTREKLKFDEDMTQYVPREQLWTEWGGDLQFDYDHAEYWPALMALCAEKRAARLDRWIKGGKHLGELEDFLSGKIDVGVAEVEAIPDKVEKPKTLSEDSLTKPAVVLIEKAPVVSESELVVADAAS